MLRPLSSGILTTMLSLTEIWHASLYPCRTSFCVRRSRSEAVSPPRLSPSSAITMRHFPQVPSPLQSERMNTPASLARIRRFSAGSALTIRPSGSNLTSTDNVVCDDLPHAPVQTSCKFLASFLFCRELYSFQVCSTNHQAGSRYEGLPFFSHD